MLLILIKLVWLLPLFCCTTEIVLHNQYWNVTVDLATLALRVKLADHLSVVVSEGSTPHLVSPPEITENYASWQWDQGQWKLQAELKDRDLLITIEAQKPGWLSIIQQPAAAIGNGLILPQAEGHYIPQYHPIWEDYLVNQIGTLNTNEDLSLPLWGMDHGQHSFHWIFTNPFNNQLTFHRNSSGLDLAFSHEFTSIEPNTPFTAILHLADSNRLAGAHRYREWLLAQGLFEHLAEKLEKQPQGRKLLGATHVYVWGNGPLAAEDVLDWSAFITALQADTSFSRELWHRFSFETQTLINNASVLVPPYQQILFIREFNQALTDSARSYWQHPTIDLEQLGSCYQTLFQQLRKHFGHALQPNSTHWGGGLSVKTIQQLQAARLTHLWIGSADGWEGGLWHPSAVAQAVQAGYLVAPYDSYETALPPGQHPDWSTAHQGLKIYHECGVVQANGELKPGFQQQGVYTNPTCVRPFLELRIRRIQSVTGYNSWFLDCYASGTVFNDYRQGVSMPQAIMAQENINSMQWIADEVNNVVGSEGGNAVTSRGLFFAHGVQTPVIGWGDPDLTDPESPYYLGQWFPPEKPTLFFKQVALKDLYKTVHFDVRHRLPLYQAVFHDSLITTHHWLFDNLKLSNVQRENTLTQLLYNVPPLYHLNRESLSERILGIQRQDIFFKPVHQHLATQALTGFRWLNEEGTLQQTQFADSSWLIANFEGVLEYYEGVVLPGYSVTANLSSGGVTRYIFE